MTLHDLDTAYRGHYHQLYRVAYRIAGSRENAEDAMQDAYLSAFKAVESFRGESAASTWLYRITVNCALKYTRRRKSFPVSALAAEVGLNEAEFFARLADHETVEDTVVTENLRETCLQMFLECMPGKQRTAFVLNVLMQLPGDLVAQIMGISRGAVKTNVYRARQHMVDNMEGRCSLIRKGNPCSCGLWAAYSLRTGKDRYFQNEAPVRNSRLDYKNLLVSELSFLGKVMALYDAAPDSGSPDAFIHRMKVLIADEQLHLLKI